MTQTDKQITVDQVKHLLRAFNSDKRNELDGFSVCSFYLEYDDALEGVVANVIFVIDADEVDNDLDTIDKYCALVSHALDSVVEFTYCTYRTAKEYKEDFDNDQWRTVLHEVGDDAN